MTISTNRESDRFMLRLPDGMRDRLKDEAAKNNRSMNAEIVHRLQMTLDSQPSMTASEVQEKIFGKVFEPDADEKAPPPADLLLHELTVAAAHAIEQKLAELSHQGLTAMYFDVAAEANPRLFYKPPTGATKPPHGD